MKLGFMAACAAALASSAAMADTGVELTRGVYVERRAPDGSRAIEPANSLAPGERVTREIIRQLQEAGTRERFGVEGEYLRCANV